MTTKIYFDNKPVYLSDESEYERTINNSGTTAFLTELTPAAFDFFLKQLNQNTIQSGIACYPQYEKLRDFFFSRFTPIEAAGGIVRNEKNQLLFIFRHGKWDLPKGKVEPNESNESAALREVTEETGVTDLRLEQSAGTTYHTYEAFGCHFLKTTHWFFMRCAGNPTLTPQTEEGISEIKWMDSNNLKEPMSNTFASIADILQNLKTTD